MQYQVEVTIKDMLSEQVSYQGIVEVESLTSEEAQSDALVKLEKERPELFQGRQVSVDALVHPPTGRGSYELEARPSFSPGDAYIESGIERHLAWQERMREEARKRLEESE